MRQHKGRIAHPRTEDSKLAQTRTINAMDSLAWQHNWYGRQNAGVTVHEVNMPILGCFMGDLTSFLAKNPSVNPKLGSDPVNRYMRANVEGNMTEKFFLQ